MTTAGTVGAPPSHGPSWLKNQAFGLSLWVAPDGRLPKVYWLLYLSEISTSVRLVGLSFGERVTRGWMRMRSARRENAAEVVVADN